MNRRNAFVPEVPIDFEYAWKPAHDQPLQIEFRRDAKIEIDTESIMVRDKGFCRRATGDRMHHRRFDFKEASFDEEGSNASDDSAASGKDAMDLRIGNQVDIALPIAGFHVRQPVPLFWKRSEGFAQEGKLCDPNGEFICLRAKENAGHADPIA